MATKSLDSLSDLPLSYLLDNPLSPQLQPESSVFSASASAQKRGRGRPPKPKSDSHQNRQAPTNLNNVSVPVVSEHDKRPRGRPRKDGGVTPTAFQAAPMAAEAAVKQKAPGKQRKFKPVSSLESERVTPIVQDGPRKRGRPKKCDTAAVAVPASIEFGEEATADVAPAKKRGRPPKVGGVISVSRTGRSRGRPRKDAAAAVAEFPREGTADNGALKRKYEFLQEKVTEAANKLKASVSAMEEVRVIAAAMNSG